MVGSSKLLPLGLCGPVSVQGFSEVWALSWEPFLECLRGPDRFPVPASVFWWPHRSTECPGVIHMCQEIEGDCGVLQGPGRPCHGLYL